MRVVTWNVQGNRGLSDESLKGIKDALGALQHPPDIVCLQEVHRSSFPKLRDALQSIGLMNVRFSEPKGDRPKHGEVIASHHEIGQSDDSWTLDAPYPALFANTVVKVDGREVEVVSAHIPNGSSNGWDKIRHFEALHGRLVSLKGKPVIVAGDFNEPRHFSADGPAITFGHKELGPGKYSAEGELTRPKNEKIRPKETFPRQRWVQAVRSVLDGAGEHGLEHAHLKQHGRGDLPVTHQTMPRNGNPKTAANDRFFDHILVSGHFEVEDAGYYHEWREQEISDHSGGWATLRLR